VSRRLRYLDTVIFILMLIFLISFSYVHKSIDSSLTQSEQIKNPFLDSLAHHYELKVNQAILANDVPGVAFCIVYDTSYQYQKGLGVKEYGKADPINTKTVFRIGSLSKGFAAVLTGMLVDDQLLQWEDKVSKYVPGFELRQSDNSAVLKIEHLLSHTSGLPRHSYTNLIEAGLSLDKIMPRLGQLQLISEAGELYSYQNAAFSIISKIIEQATGQSYHWQLKRRIFLPLGMKQASADFESISKQANVAMPHKKTDGSWETEEISQRYYNAIAAGGINASIEDMAEWIGLLLGNTELISKATLQNIFDPYISTDIDIRYFNRWDSLKSTAYGMGWRIMQVYNKEVVYHGGFVNGYRSEIAIIPDSKIGICVLTNGLNKFSNRCIPVFLRKHHELKDSIAVWDHRMHSTSGAFVQ